MKMDMWGRGLINYMCYVSIVLPPACTCRYHKNGQSLLVLLPSEEPEMLKVGVTVKVLKYYCNLHVFQCPPWKFKYSKTTF